MANDSIGEEVQKLVAGLPEGGVLLLENVRFYKEEEKNDPEFAKSSPPSPTSTSTTLSALLTEPTLPPRESPST